MLSSHTAILSALRDGVVQQPNPQGRQRSISQSLFMARHDAKFGRGADEGHAIARGRLLKQNSPRRVLTRLLLGYTHSLISQMSQTAACNRTIAGAAALPLLLLTSIEVLDRTGDDAGTGRRMLAYDAKASPARGTCNAPASFVPRAYRVVDRIGWRLAVRVLRSAGKELSRHRSRGRRRTAA